MMPSANDNRVLCYYFSIILTVVIVTHTFFERRDRHCGGVEWVRGGLLCQSYTGVAGVRLEHPKSAGRLAIATRFLCQQYIRATDGETIVQVTVLIATVIVNSALLLHTTVGKKTVDGKQKQKKNPGTVSIV